MLGKLMKYEFLATGRIFLPLFAALIVLSAVNRAFTLNFVMGTAESISRATATILIVAICVVALIITLQRFRRNLLGNEGYLMMTLPVKADLLILSKLFTAAIWVVACFIVIGISITLMGAIEFAFNDFAWFFRSIGQSIARQPVQAILGIVLTALSMFSGILMLYACMALSMLVNRRRGLFTFGAFIVISTFLQTIFAILMAVAIALNVGATFNITRLSSFGQAQVTILFFIAIEAILCAAFYFTTRYMLKRR